VGVAEGEHGASSLPGFMICRGSNTDFSARISAISSPPREKPRKSRFSRPTPCSAEMLPFSAATRSKICGLMA
jgi:hypothetical protein